jgi:sterol desaturase/sphingolipid hydroxylase (fatty acid hydroxylase superfamily)
LEYLKTFIDGYTGYAAYLWNTILTPGWHNYFYWLLLVSVFFFLMELLKPWRETQPIFRKDFWLDFFYMFFNFFLFSLVFYNAASNVVAGLFNDAIFWASGFDLQASNPLNGWPLWAILLTGFLVSDFIQWWVHRLLHHSPALWEFHKVHHSVEQMGFAAHLRYHWMENVVYRTIQYVPLALMGIGLYDFFIIHIFTLAVGHYNHSNITMTGWVSGGVVGVLIGLVIATGGFDIHLLHQPDFGQQALVVVASALVGVFLLGRVMKIVFNSPEMHIWHHSYDLPKNKPYGINFGISLAIWDYIFGTAHVPFSGQNIRLGFPNVERFPGTFFSQVFYGFSEKDNAAHRMEDNDLPPA